MYEVSRALRWTILGGVGLLLLTPIVIAPTFFFPFITGKNFFARIIIDVIFGLYIGLAILDARYRPQLHRVGLALAAFVLALSAATIFSVDSYRSFWSNFERMEGLVTILHMFALFVIVAHIVRDAVTWRYLLATSLLVSVLSAGYGFLQMTGGVAIVGDGRPAAGFGNSIYLSVYIMLHMIIFGYLAITSRSSRRWWYASCTALLAIVFSASGSRGAFIGVAAAVGVVVLWNALTASTVRARSIMAGIAVTGALALGLIFMFPHNIFVRNVQVLDRLSATDLSMLGSDSRVLIWKIGIEGFTHRPLLGWGPGNFIVPFAEYYDSDLFTAEPWFDRTHNMFVEWLVTAGIIGFVAYISIFITWGLTIKSLLYRNVIENKEAMALTALIVAYGVQNVFVFDNIATYLFIAFFSAYLVSRDLWQDSQPPSVVSASPVRIIAAASAVVMGLVIAIMLNAKPIVVSAKLITALRGFSEKNITVEQVLQRFSETIELGTFGQTEVRERLADTLVSLSTQEAATSPQYIQLLDFAIAEYEKELTEHKRRLRDIIFTGKLHSIRYVVSNQKSSRDRAYELYESAIEQSPNYIQGRLGLAEVALASGDYPKAIEQGRISYDKVGNKDGIFYPVISIYLVANDAALAQELLTQYTDPTIFDGFDESKSIEVIKRALIVISTRERLPFLEAYEEAWRFGNPHGIIYLALAQTYGELGRFQDAENAARRAAELTPTYQEQVDDFVKVLYEAR